MLMESCPYPTQHQQLLHEDLLSSDSFTAWIDTSFIMLILRTLSTKASLDFHADRFFKTTASYINKSFAVGIGELAPNTSYKERVIIRIKSWLKQ